MKLLLVVLVLAAGVLAFAFWNGEDGGGERATAATQVAPDVTPEGTDDSDATPAVAPLEPEPPATERRPELPAEPGPPVPFRARLIDDSASGIDDEPVWLSVHVFEGGRMMVEPVFAIEETVLPGGEVASELATGRDYLIVAFTDRREPRRFGLRVPEDARASETTLTFGPPMDRVELELAFTAPCTSFDTELLVTAWVGEVRLHSERFEVFLGDGEDAGEAQHTLDLFPGSYTIRADPLDDAPPHPDGVGPFTRAEAEVELRSEEEEETQLLVLELAAR